MNLWMSHKFPERGVTARAIEKRWIVNDIADRKNFIFLF